MAAGAPKADEVTVQTDGSSPEYDHGVDHPPPPPSQPSRIPKPVAAADNALPQLTDFLIGKSPHSFRWSSRLAVAAHGLDGLGPIPAGLSPKAPGLAIGDLSAPATSVPSLKERPQQVFIVGPELLISDDERDDADIPLIDIVLLGLGDDAHTASLFPETEALKESNRLFVANFIPKFSAYRLTLTAPIINAARNVAFLVCGASKRPAVDVVMHGPRHPDEYPAQLIEPKLGRLWWFLDAAAASEVLK